MRSLRHIERWSIFIWNRKKLKNKLLKRSIIFRQEQNTLGMENEKEMDLNDGSDPIFSALVVKHEKTSCPTVVINLTTEKNDLEEINHGLSKSEEEEVNHGLSKSEEEEDDDGMIMEIDLDEWKIHFGEFQLWMRMGGRMPHPCSQDNIEQELYKFCNEQWKNKEFMDESIIGLLESTERWFWGQCNTNFDGGKSMIKKDWEILYGSLTMWTRIKNRMPYPGTTDEMENEQFEFCNEQWKNKDSLSTMKISKLETISVWFWGNALEVVQPNDKEVRKSKAITMIKTRQPIFCEKQKIRKKSVRGKEIKKGKRSFEERFSELRQWVRLNKRLPTSQSKSEEEKFLTRFCLVQRRQERIGNLSGERKQKMKSLPGWQW